MTKGKDIESVQIPEILKRWRKYVVTSGAVLLVLVFVFSLVYMPMEEVDGVEQYARFSICFSKKIGAPGVKNFDALPFVDVEKRCISGIGDTLTGKGGGAIDFANYIQPDTWDAEEWIHPNGKLRFASDCTDGRCLIEQLTLRYRFKKSFGWGNEEERCTGSLAYKRRDAFYGEWQGVCCPIQSTNNLHYAREKRCRPIVVIETKTPDKTPKT